MADRYWVGGAGTWDATDTTHWSASSGGAAGASAPTSVDNVIFNTLSNATAYAVTVGTNANAQDVTIAGPATGNVTITMGATAVINCYGSWTNAATGVAFSATAGCLLVLASSTTGRTFTTNAVTLNSVSIITNQVSGGWTLGGALTFTGTLAFQAGSFDTGNYNINCGIVQNTGTSVRSVTLGTSTITVSNAAPWVFSTTTNLTFNAGTSTIVCSATNPTFAGGGLTYYNVTFSSVSVTAITMTGANTFNNLTFPVRTTSGFGTVTFSANITVTGTFTSITSSNTMRLLFASSVLGTQITLTAGTTSLTYADFRDIVGAGTAAWTGTSIGNCLNNSGITFDTPKTVYWNLGGSVNWANTGWATTSGGAPAAANFPLAQDTAVFNNAGSAVSIGGFNHQVGTIDMSARTTAIALNNAGTQNIYGSFINSTGATWTASGTFNFFGRSAQTITSNNIAFTQSFGISMFGGTLTLQDNFSTASTQTVTLTNGTLNLVSYTLTTGLFSSTNTNVRVLAFGTGKIVLTSTTGTVLSMSTVTNFTYTGTSRIEITASGAGRTITPPSTSAVESNVMSIYVTTGSDTVTVSGAARFLNFDLTGFSGTLTYASSSRYFGNLIFSSGMTLGTIASTFIFAQTSGTQTITSAGKTIDTPVTIDATGAIVQCTDALTLGSTQTLTLTNGTLKLAAGTTSTVGSFATSGSNQKYLQSTTSGTQASISDASGTNTVTYLTIKDSNATGGAVFNALGITNVDAGNNTGWLFSTIPSVSNEITMRLRSFTQPRRF